jgi:hypothetical protein
MLCGKLGEKSLNFPHSETSLRIRVILDSDNISHLQKKQILKKLNHYTL